MSADRRDELVGEPMVVDAKAASGDLVPLAERVSKLLRKAALTVVLSLSLISGAFADFRKSYVTDKGGKVGDLSLGCLPKTNELKVYSRTESKAPPFEDESILRAFPQGFTQQTQLQTEQTVTFMVESIIRSPEREILRGHLVDSRGLVFQGVFYVFPQDWNCTLVIEQTR